MTRRHIVRRLSGPIAIVLIGAGWLAWRQPHGPKPEPALSSSTLPSGPATPVRAPAPAPRPIEFPAPPVADEPPLGVQVERLLATRNPRDAYRAYWLLADCATFNLAGDRLVFDREEASQPRRGTLPGFRSLSEEEKRHDARLCAGMTERERQSRLDYLAIAARAGVPGAAVDFATEGPFGDPSALQTRPDDPLVQSWCATANAQLRQAAELGADLAAITYLGEAYARGSAVAAADPLLAYRYTLARHFIDEDLLGPGDPLSQALASQREALSKRMDDFSPDQRAAELAAARRIAALARTLREQAARRPNPS